MNMFDLISPRLRMDRRFILNLVAEKGVVMQKLPSIFLADEEVVLTGIKNSAVAFKLASKTLKHHIPFVLKAYKVNQDILKFVSKKITQDASFQASLAAETDAALTEASAAEPAVSTQPSTLPQLGFFSSAAAASPALLQDEVSFSSAL